MTSRDALLTDLVRANVAAIPVDRHPADHASIGFVQQTQAQRVQAARRSVSGGTAWTRRDGVLARLQVVGRMRGWTWWMW